MIRQTCYRGLQRSYGKKAPAGYVIDARNFRFGPDDPTRLMAIMGRAKFNSSVIGAAASPAADDATVKTLHSFLVDGGTSKMCVHKGGSIWEADLVATGTFSEAYAFSTSTATPRGTFAPYKNLLYYPIGADGWSATRRFLVRESAAWTVAGHITPTAAFVIAGEGSGSYGSTTEIRGIIRIYDSTTDTESAHGAVVSLAAPGETFTDFRYTFAAGVALQDGERGTHLRIYQTLHNEEPGLYFRVDGTGDGIALASVTPGFTFDHQLTTTEMQINGTVRADGEAGTNAWAEHGGQPPQARGAIPFNDHMIWWGINGNFNGANGTSIRGESVVMYSARGYPETSPVDFDGNYQYYLVMSSPNQDEVQRCSLAGPFVLAFTESAIFRFRHLPTYADPGFDRIVQDNLAVDHGICGPWASDYFGVGQEEREMKCVYVSREYGPMLTAGYYTERFLRQSDWRNLVEEAQLANTVVRTYPTMQEVWIYYTPSGGTENTQALILDYSDIGNRGVRLTGPVDVQANEAHSAKGNDDVTRYYLLGGDAATVYVQDSGSTDAQQNTNVSGDIALELEFPRVFPGGLSKNRRMRKCFVDCGGGVELEFSAQARVLNGKQSFTRYGKVKVGAGEIVDSFLVDHKAQGISTRLTYTGPTGSTMKDEDAGQVPWVRMIEYREDAAGEQKQTRTS